MNNTLPENHILSIGVRYYMYATFLRKRIEQLRLKKNVSEYQMSYDLGHSRSYINNICSGKALPSMSEFFSICEYFNTTPKDFFDETIENPPLVKQAMSSFRQLSYEDMLLILSNINRLLKS